MQRHAYNNNQFRVGGEEGAQRVEVFKDLQNTVKNQ